MNLRSFLKAGSPGGLVIVILLAGGFAVYGGPAQQPAGEPNHSLAHGPAERLALAGTAFPGAADSPRIEELPVLPELSEHPEIRLREAFRAEIAGDNKRALAAYEAFFAEGEDSAHARAAYGRLLAVNRRSDDALRELDRAIELAPEANEYAILKGEVLRRAGRDEAALEFLNDARFQYEDDPGIEFLLGELQYDARNYPAAMQHHKRTLVHLKLAAGRAATYRSISLWRLADLSLRDNRLEAAGEYLVRYLRHNPRRHYPRFILADRVYYRMGRYEDARRELESLLRNDLAELASQSVDVARAYGLLCRVYFLFRDVRFLAALNQNAAFNEKQQPGIVERALALAHRGAEREALQLLLPIVKRQEDTVFIPWVAILRIVRDSGRPGLYADQLTHVAAIAVSFGRHRMALDWLKQAREIKAQHPDASVSETRINQVFASHYEAMGQNYRASLFLQRALRAATPAVESRDGEERADSKAGDDDPAPGESVVKKSELKKSAAPAGATTEFEEDPADVIARLKLTRASILSKSGVARYDQALAIARSAGETALSYATRGEIEYSRGDLAAAETAYDRAIELVPQEAAERQQDPRVREVLGIGRRSRSRYLFMRAVVRYERENSAGAITDLEQSLELNSKFAPGANFLAYLYARENRRLLTALRLVDEAIESDPINGHYVDTLAWIHYRRGDFVRARYHSAFAVRVLEFEASASEALAFQGVEPEMLSHLGDILSALSRPDQARSQYRRARTLLRQRSETQAPGRRFGVHERRLLEALEQKLENTKGN